MTQRARTRNGRPSALFTKLPVKVRVLAGGLLLGLSSACLAAAPTPDAPSATIKRTIEARIPGSHVLDVQPAAVPGLPGLYEIFMGDQIVYSDATGDHVLMGPLVETQTRQNLTEAHLNDHGKIDFNTLPFDRAIKVVKGNGSRRFAVFSDPDCPFCQRLEQSLVPVTNTTMYVFLYPIGSLHPQASAKAHSIWCAKDRSQAWSQWMHEKKLPSATHCSGDPVDELQKLADNLHINGTPTLFFPDGQRVAGAIDTGDIEKHLAGPAKQAGPTAPPAAHAAPASPTSR